LAPCLCARIPAEPAVRSQRRFQQNFRAGNFCSSGALRIAVRQQGRPWRATSQTRFSYVTHICDTPKLVGRPSKIRKSDALHEKVRSFAVKTSYHSPLNSQKAKSSALRRLPYSSRNRRLASENTHSVDYPARTSELFGPRDHAFESRLSELLSPGRAFAGNAFKFFTMSCTIFVDMLVQYVCR